MSSDNPPYTSNIVQIETSADGNKLSSQHREGIIETIVEDTTTDKIRSSAPQWSNEIVTIKQEDQNTLYDISNEVAIGNRVDVIAKRKDLSCRKNLADEICTEVATGNRRELSNGHIAENITIKREKLSSHSDWSNEINADVAINDRGEPINRERSNEIIAEDVVIKREVLSSDNDWVNEFNAEVTNGNKVDVTSRGRSDEIFAENVIIKWENVYSHGDLSDEITTDVASSNRIEHTDHDRADEIPPENVIIIDEDPSDHSNLSNEFIAEVANDNRLKHANHEWSRSIRSDDWPTESITEPVNNIVDDGQNQDWSKEITSLCRQIQESGEHCIILHFNKAGYGCGSGTHSGSKFLHERTDVLTSFLSTCRKKNSDGQECNVGGTEDDVIVDLTIDSDNESIHKEEQKQVSMKRKFPQVNKPSKKSRVSGLSAQQLEMQKSTNENRNISNMSEEERQKNIQDLKKLNFAMWQCVKQMEIFKKYEEQGSPAPEQKRKRGRPKKSEKLGALRPKYAPKAAKKSAQKPKKFLKKSGHVKNTSRLPHENSLKGIQNRNKSQTKPYVKKSSEKHSPPAPETKTNPAQKPKKFIRRSCHLKKPPKLPPGSSLKGLQNRNQSQTRPDVKNSSEEQSPPDLIPEIDCSEKRSRQNHRSRQLLPADVPPAAEKPEPKPVEIRKQPTANKARRFLPCPMPMSAITRGCNFKEEWDSVMNSLKGLQKKNNSQCNLEMNNTLEEFMTEFGKIRLRENNVKKLPSVLGIRGLDVHPTNDCLLVAAGGQFGRLGLWQRSFEADDNQEILMSFTPHKKGINCVKFSPYNWSHMLSASNDGTVKLCDLDREMFYKICAVRDERRPNLRYVDFMFEHVMLVAGSSGNVCLIDTRTSKIVPEQLFHLHDEILFTVSVHPVSRNHFVTASDDHTAKLWDLRRLHIGKNPRKANMSLNSVKHHKPVASAFFSPVTGKYLLSTLTKPYRRNGNHKTEAMVVSEYTDGCFTKMSTIQHYIQTYRNHMHGVWHPRREDMFVLGTTRRLDPFKIKAYDVNGALLKEIQDEDLLTTVCCRNAMHPTRNILVSADTNDSLVHLFL